MKTCTNHKCQISELMLSIFTLENTNTHCARLYQAFIQCNKPFAHSLATQSLFYILKKTRETLIHFNHSLAPLTNYLSMLEIIDNIKNPQIISVVFDLILYQHSHNAYDMLIGTKKLLLFLRTKELPYLKPCMNALPSDEFYPNLLTCDVDTELTHLLGNNSIQLTEFIFCPNNVIHLFLGKSFYETLRHLYEKKIIETTCDQVLYNAIDFIPTTRVCTNSTDKAHLVSKHCVISLF